MTADPLFSFEPLVARLMAIEDFTIGRDSDEFLIRFRGRLYGEDSAAAYDELAQLLKPFIATPVFRWDAGRHAILIIPGLQQPKPSNPWVNLALFVLTLASVLFTGALYGLEEALPTDPAAATLEMIRRGWPFAVSLLAILGAHEFGHYFAGRFHKVHVTLPYFIPFPASPFGTFGAFINMKETPRNRRQLLDIGLAGPLAGLVVTLPVLWLGLSLSKVTQLPTEIPAGLMMQMEGNSLLYLAMKYLVYGQLLPAPASYGALPAALYWLKYFFTGQPFPYGGMDVTLHPVAWAGWAGLLVTGMNLLPVGQLDGGHVMYVLLGRDRMRRAFPWMLAAMGVLGFFWSGWWFWGAVLWMFGRNYAEPLDLITPLDGRRKALAIAAFVLFVLIFTPVPLILVS